MAKFCSQCAEPLQDMSNFCSKCGNRLERGNSQHFRNIHNEGAFIAPQGIQGPVTITTHHGQNPFHLPALDLSPTARTEGWSLKTQFNIAYAMLGFASCLCTLFGFNIFDIPTFQHLDGWLYGVVLPLALGGVAVFAFREAYYLKHYGNIRYGGKLRTSIDGRTFTYLFRCVCPVSRCGGIMAPKTDKDSKRVWECGNNHAHRMDFDVTQGDHAIKTGQLDPKP